MPKFSIPKEFQVEDDPTGKKGENKYLRHLTYIGAEKRYKELTDDIRERIDFELSIIEKQDILDTSLLWKTSSLPRAIWESL